MSDSPPDPQPDPQPDPPAGRPPVRFVHHPLLTDYRLAEGHPFKPVRLELTRSLLYELDLLRPEHEAPPEALDDAELERVHHPDYLRAVRAASRGERLDEALRYGLGSGDNPVFDDMHESVKRVCGATVAAVELVASGAARRALSLAGGLHHALHARASGFCVYNDLALGIERAVRRHRLRVAYLDLDAHHGDGVQWLFYDRPEVMTVSLHESGRYLFPGTGHAYEIGEGAARGTSVNVPLEPFTDDASFEEAFETVVPAALRAFAPDLIVLQAGADMHRHDPLAHLSLTLDGQRRSYRRVVALADEVCGGRLVATGGGGYDPYRTVPRAWAWLWAALTGADLPERLPEAWRRRWRAEAAEHGVEPPATALDDTSGWPPQPRRELAAGTNRALARRLLQQLEPLWAALPPRPADRPTD